LLSFRVSYNSVSGQKHLVEELKRKGIEDKRILDAFLQIPRELFVPEIYRPLAYEDVPIPLSPIETSSLLTTSTPSLIAFMVQNLLIERDSKVLEIGTGSGYQTAILAFLAKEVFSIERVKSLGQAAKERIISLGIKNVHFRFGDGFFGWEEEKPFDRIIIGCSCETFPPPLLAQLRDGGRAIYPQKRGEKQFLYLCLKLSDRIKLRPLREVNFSLLVRERHGA
jgi:protein-L-isoaspartate(D-aspartate) O-methyltransferase